MSDQSTPARSRAHLNHAKYKFPPGAKDGEGNPLTEIVLRELDSHDILKASKDADERGTDGSQERVAKAIVRVNGQPFAVGTIDGWNQIAVEFAMLAYMRLSSTRSDVVEALLAAGEAVPA